MSLAWPETLSNRAQIRQRGAFHIYGAQASDGSRRLVVIAAPGTDTVAANARLDELVRAHELVQGPLFPRVAERYGEPPLVAFRSDAIADGELLFARLGQTGRKISYPQAIAFVRALGDGLIALHDTRDPVSGRPMALGSVCWANFFFSGEGHPVFVGLGHNVITRTEQGRASGAPGVFSAPEIATGAAPTPGGDLYACVAMFRSMFPFVELPALLVGAFQGTGAGPMPRLVRWANRAVLAAPPRARPSIRVAMVAFERMWSLLGVKPDAQGFGRLVAALFEEASAVLTVARDGAFFVDPSGARHTLERRRAPRRILLALVEAHAQGDAILGLDALLEAGWPGETLVAETGQNRVYVALNLLRSLGLRGVLQRFDGGYRVDPSVRVVWAEGIQDGLA